MTIVDVIRQMIEDALFSSAITSASPGFVNVVRSLDINPSDYEAVVQAEIRRAVEDAVGIQGGPAGSSPLRAKTPPKGMLFQMFIQDFGGLGKARQAMAFLSDPKAVIIPIVGKLFRAGGAGAGILTAALASYPIIVFLTKQLTKRGSFFDLTFRNIIDNRVNVLRTRESQQEIRRGIEGKSQIILTTRAGTVDPVFSWNTYEQINNNELEFEKIRAIRSVFVGP